MGNAARDAGVVARRMHLVVAIDRLLVRLLAAAPGRWVVKGGYANQLRRPDDARFTEDLDLKIDAAMEKAPELLASGFAVDLADDFSYEVAAPPASLEGPPGGGLRFVVVARLGGTEFVRFKVDVTAADVVVAELDSYLSDPVLERLGFRRSRFPVYPINQHVAEKLHALTLPRDVENTRARDLVDLAWFIRHFTFRSDALAEACVATFERRATHHGRRSSLRRHSLGHDPTRRGGPSSTSPMRRLLQPLRRSAGSWSQCMPGSRGGPGIRHDRNGRRSARSITRRLHPPEPLLLEGPVSYLA